jgi:hypothetical protein
LEAISRKKEVDEVIEIKKSLRGFYKSVQNTPPLEWVDVVADYPVAFRGIGVNPSMWIQEDSIDISGLTTHMEKALAVSHVDVYQPPNYTASFFLNTQPPYNVTASMMEIILITDTPFNFNRWEAGLSGTLFQLRLPGVFSDAQPSNTEVLSTDEIIFGRYRKIVNDIEAPGSVTRIAGESFWGDAKITMSDRLYVYRIVNFDGGFNLGDVISVPEMQLVINGHKTELTDLEQVMELRRSYLLQQDI